jgi:RecA/RadA recombinase
MFDLMEDRKQQLEAIFDGAIALESAEQREIYLARTCGQDLVLRSEAEALIRAYEKAGNFLTHEGSEADQNSSKPASGRIAMAAAVETPGTVVGRHKLREKIGEGGCGVVYMAEQQRPVRRKVALKIIKPGMDTREVIARFESERQALALMDHPNIARVLDAGATKGTSAKQIADVAEIVIVSLPTPQIVQAVANEVAQGSKVKVFIDTSTTGARGSASTGSRTSRLQWPYIGSPSSVRRTRRAVATN